MPVAPVLFGQKKSWTTKPLYDGNTLVKINQPGYGGKVGEFVTVGVPFTLAITSLHMDRARRLAATTRKF